MDSPEIHMSKKPEPTRATKMFVLPGHPWLKVAQIYERPGRVWDEPSELELMSLTIEIDNTHIIIEYPRWGFLILIQKFHLSFFLFATHGHATGFLEKKLIVFFIEINIGAPVQCDLSCAFISVSHCFMTSGDFLFFQSRFGSPRIGYFIHKPYFWMSFYF